MSGQSCARSDQEQVLTDAGSMTPKVTPDAVADCWKLAPAALAWPNRTPGLIAAVFAASDTDRLVLPSPRDEQTHVISIELAPCDIAFELDGKLKHVGVAAPGTVNIAPAGTVPLACVSGSWRVLQIYMPDRDLRSLAEELGATRDDACALAVRDPNFAPDPALAALAVSLDRRLSRGEPVSRLELDEIALAVGEHLLLNHSSCKTLRRGETPLTCREIAAVTQYLLEADDVDLDGLARLIGRPAAEAHHAIRRAGLRYRPRDPSENRPH